jgi:hypothetical protein
MAQSTELPGISCAGILQPKQKNRFMVAFRATVVNPEHEAAVQTILQRLTMQIIGVKLPKVVLTSTQGPRFLTPGAFARYGHQGPLELIFQDDVLNFVAEGVDILSNGTCSWLGVTAIILDGNESALEAYDFRNVRFQFFQANELDYATGDTISKTVTCAAETLHLARFDGGIKLSTLLKGLN